MKWFGKAGGAPYEHDCKHVATPVGLTCCWCNEAITVHDDGLLLPGVGLDSQAVDFAYHYECHLRSIVGGVNHVLRLCHCPGCAGLLPPDPPHLSRREAAILLAGVM